MQSRALVALSLTLGVSACQTASVPSPDVDAGTRFTTLVASVGPLSVAPGEERVDCVVVDLGNAEDAFVRRFRTTLAQGSHHMIVYRSNAPAEDLHPTPCVSFGGVLAGEPPLFIAESAASELDFPTERGAPVGLRIHAHQLVRLEMHMIDTTSTALDVSGRVEIDTVPVSPDVIPSDLAFWGTTDFTIPPSSVATTGLRFQAALAGTKSFALTTHQHHLGTRARAWLAMGPEASGEPLIDARSWSSPPLVLLDPPIEFPENGGARLSAAGLAYQCDWKNPTPKQVPFGESADDEMCFLWHYYYPSKGFSACVDGFCK